GASPPALPLAADDLHSLRASHTGRKDRSASSFRTLQSDRRASSDSLRAALQSLPSATQMPASLLCGSAPIAFRTEAPRPHSETQFLSDIAARLRPRTGHLQNPEKCPRSSVPAVAQTRCLL